MSARSMRLNDHGQQTLGKTLQTTHNTARALAYTIAYWPCAPRLLTLWARAGPVTQGQ